MFILQRIDEPPKPDTAPQKTTSTRTTKTGNLKTKSIAAAAGGAGAAGGAAASGKAAAATSAAALKREAQRKQLMEMKRQRREALAAAKNQTACDGAGAAGEGVEAASTNNNAELDVTVATVASATIGDTVNIAVKNSS